MPWYTVIVGGEGAALVQSVESLKLNVKESSSPTCNPGRPPPPELLPLQAPPCPRLPYGNAKPVGLPRILEHLDGPGGPTLSRSPQATTAPRKVRDDDDNDPHSDGPKSSFHFRF